MYNTVKATNLLTPPFWNMQHLDAIMANCYLVSTKFTYPRGKDEPVAF